MGSLHITFIECLAYIVTGYVYKVVMIRSSEQRSRIRLYSNFIIHVILPVFIFRSIVNIRKFPSEGWVDVLVFIALEILSAIAGLAIYRKLDYEKWPTLYVTMFGFNTCIFFYPILEQVVGAEGIANMIMFDIPNLITTYALVPLLFLYVKTKTGNNNEDEMPDVELSTETDENERHEERRRTKKDYTEIKEEEEEENNEGNERNVKMNSDDDEIILEEGIMEEEEEEERNNENVSNKKCNKLTKMFDVVDVVPTGNEAKEISKKRTESSYRMSPNMRKKEIATRILKSIFMNGPFLSIVFSFICFGAGLKLPTWIDNLLEKISRTLTFLGMALMGMLLDLHPRLVLKNIKWVGITMLTRYSVGAVVAVFNYFVVFPYISPATRVIAFLGPFMPAPIMASVFVIDNGYDPFLTSLTVNSFTVVSFFIIWILFTFIDFNDGYSSSSSSSTLLYNMTLSLSSSSSSSLP